MKDIRTNREALLDTVEDLVKRVEALEGKATPKAASVASTKKK